VVGRDNHARKIGVSALVSSASSGPNRGQVNRIDRGPARPSGGWLREVDVETVRRDGWKDLLPADPDGVEKISKAVVSADGQGHADFHTPRLSDLFAAEGFEQTRPLPSVRPSS
jgi:hypothetical protein